MIKNLFSLAIIALAGSCINQIDAQTLKPIYIDVNAGVVRRSSDNVVLNSCVRENFDYGECWDFNSDMRVRNYYIEVKPEFALNRKLALDAGLRLTCSYGKLEDDNQLLWKAKEDGIKTYYVTVEQAMQHSFYIGVPLGIRFAPVDLNSISPFVKFGVSFNYLVGHKNTVTTALQSQSVYEDKIEKLMGAPDALAVPIYFSGGIQCGHDGSINIEVIFPCIFDHSQTYSLCKLSSTGFGLSLGMRLPQFNNKE